MQQHLYDSRESQLQEEDCECLRVNDLEMYHSFCVQPLLLSCQVIDEDTALVSPQCLAYKGSTLELYIFLRIIFSVCSPHLYFGSIILRLVPTISLINHSLSKFTGLLWFLAGIFMHQMKDLDFFGGGTQEKLTIYVTSGMEEYS